MLQHRGVRTARSCRIVALAHNSDASAAESEVGDYMINQLRAVHIELAGGIITQSEVFAGH